MSKAIIEFDNQLEGNLMDEIEGIMENSFYNPVNYDQPEHRILEQLVSTSSLHNKDA